MPCYDSRNSYEYRSRELQDKCNKLTRMLCEVMTHNQDAAISEELKAWWAEHQEIDRKRAMAEQASKEMAAQAEKVRLERIDVIAALTPRQRELLNL